SAPNYLAWRQANHVFTEMGAVDNFRTVNLGAQGSSEAAGQPEALRAAAVSPEFFRVLGVEPQCGRIFTNEENQSGHEQVVILSHDLWERRFSSDPSIVRRTIRLNRADYAVVGVMPSSFHLLGYETKLWIPLVLTASEQAPSARGDRVLHVFGRLKPGATLAQARTEFAALAQRAESDFPVTEKGWGATVRTLPDFLVYDFGIRTAFAVMMTTVSFVLMIACANVTGLLLARAAHRRKELAIRVALGAGRRRIISQSLTEGLVISLLGGTVGLFLAYWGVDFVRAN